MLKIGLSGGSWLASHAPDELLLFLLMLSTVRQAPQPLCDAVQCMVHLTYICLCKFKSARRVSIDTTNHVVLKPNKVVIRTAYQKAHITETPSTAYPVSKASFIWSKSYMTVSATVCTTTCDACKKLCTLPALIACWDLTCLWHCFTSCTSAA